MYFDYTSDIYLKSYYMAILSVSFPQILPLIMFLCPSHLKCFEKLILNYCLIIAPIWMHDNLIYYSHVIGHSGFQGFAVINNIVESIFVHTSLSKHLIIYLKMYQLF